MNHRITKEGVQVDYVFDVEVAQRLSEFSSECERKQPGGEASPLAPKVLGGGSGTIARVQISSEDLVRASAVDCALFHSSIGRTKQTLIITELDLAEHRTFDAQGRELEQAKQELRRQRTGQATAQRPLIREPITFPDRAIIHLAGSACGRYVVKASRDGETPHISDPSASGSAIHTLEVKNLTPGKKYDLEAWQINDSDKPIESTKVKQPDAFSTREKAQQVAFTKQNITPVEEGFIVDVETSVPAVVMAEVHEYDQKTGTPGLQPPSKPFALDEFKRPLDADLNKKFQIQLHLKPGQTYQYRLTAMNADGEVTLTDWQDHEVQKTMVLFDFASPIEVAITPVGFVVKWSASLAPDKASLVVDYGARSVSSSIEKPSTDVSMALDASNTKEVLAALTSTPTSSDASRSVKPTLVATMEKKVKTIDGLETTRILHREVRITLVQENKETKAVLSTLSLSDADKNKLINAAEKATNGWGRGNFNWSAVFSVALKSLIAGIK